MFEAAVAPKPRRSTVVPAPLMPPAVLQVCTPGARAMMSCKDASGALAIWSAVMTVVDAPIMPVPLRRLAVTSISGSSTVAPCCACAACTVKTASAAPHKSPRTSHNKRSFVCARRAQPAPG